MTIDSNIVIGYLNGDRAIRVLLSEWKAERRRLFISAVSVAEALSFATLRAADIRETESFLAKHFYAVPLDEVIARDAGRLRRTYRLKLADAIIAATALAVGTPLVTRDSDFRVVRELELIIA